MKTTFTLTLLLLLVLNANSQDLSLDGDEFGICPLNQEQISIINIPQECKFDDVELEGGAASITVDVTNNFFEINADDIPQTVSVKVILVEADPDDNVTCQTTVILEDYNVLSLSGLNPTISGDVNLIVGRTATTELTAEVLYSSRANTDPFEADTYTWSLPAASQFTFSNRNSNPAILNNIADVSVNLDSEGEICVMGDNDARCVLSGSVSDEECITITRFAGQPTSIGGAPATLTCGDVNPFTVSTSPAESGLAGYTYTWSVPTGWTANPPTGLTTTITPNGLNGGEISVVADAFGYQSEATTTNIGIVDFDPSTAVTGDDLVCSSPSTFTLSPAPPGGSVTWEVTPSFAVDQSSGTGTTATFSSSGSSTGDATITFTANSACEGSETFTYDFYSGFPRITSISIDGNPGGTYNTTPVSGPTDPHYIDIDFMADSDNCVNTWAPQDIGLYQEFCDEINYYFQPDGGSYDCVKVNPTLSNACGTSSSLIIVCPSGGGGWRTSMAEMNVFPNPASQSTLVTLTGVEDVLTSKDSKLIGGKLEILDKNGILIRTRKITTDQIEVQVHNLKAGLYYVNAIFGDSRLSKTLVVK